VAGKAATAEAEGSAVTELRDAVRGFSGGMLFGIPLLYTMEVWWLGTHTEPGQMLLVLVATFAVLLLLNLTGGFRSRSNAGLGGTLQDSVEALAIGLLSSALVLALLREIGPQIGFEEALGKVVYEAMPFALGVSIARHFLNGDRIDPDEEMEGAAPNATVMDLGAAAVGAVFFALNIAPTDEVPMIAAAIGPMGLLLLVPFSLLVTYLIVFAAGFTNAEGRHEQEGILQHPLTETLAAYLVALAMTLLLLVLFQRVDSAHTWAEVLGEVVVLGLPAAVGGAAGRLAV
jgi:putative integral membrane protein (TIGR02587 family)